MSEHISSKKLADEAIDRIEKTLKRVSGYPSVALDEEWWKALVDEYRRAAHETFVQLCECGKPLDRLWSCHYCGVVPGPALKANEL